MQIRKIIALCLTFCLFGCGEGKKASDNPRASQKGGSALCIPESQLLAAGIVGGQDVKQEDYDSKLVAMLISNEFLCTAAPIAPNVLLTAAHCLHDKAKTVGAFYSSLSCESGFNKLKNTIRAQDFIIHESYDPKLSDEHPDQVTGDLALVVLATDIPEGYPIYQIADPKLIPVGSDLYLYGYGRTSSNGGGSGMLRKTQISSQNYTVDYAHKKVGMNQSGGSGICSGDSGGPSLVVINNELQILGVNSYVRGAKSDMCADQGFSTLVDSYRDWINTKLEQIKNQKR